MPLAESRFWEKVDRDGPEYLDLGPCWLWTARLNADGYGTFKLDRRSRLAYNVSFEWERGPIPVGLELDHLCRRRACVRPSHLDLVLHRENVARGTTAQKTNCVNDHVFTSANTYMRPDGGRGCRSCNLEAQRRYQARKRAA